MEFALILIPFALAAALPVIGRRVRETRLNWILGAKGSEQKKILKEIVHDIDPEFMKWAISAILGWNEKTVPGNVKHIHGTADRLLPFRYVKADIAVLQGTHLMSLNMPAEISALLKELIDTTES